MKYHIELPDWMVEESENLYSDSYKLGELSTINDTFYPGQGFHLFEDIVERFPERLDDVKIISDRGEGLSVEEFVEKLEQWTVLL